MKKDKIYPIQEIIKYYNNGKNQEECRKNFKISGFTLRNILKENNVKIRNKSEAAKEFTCNENYFENINTSDKAYFLGLLIADGWLNKKGFGISLQEEDSYILQKLKLCLSYTGNITKYRIKNGNIMNSLVITSIKIKEDLEKHGILKNKTHKTYFPNIPEELYSHFIRGVFDGDGSISFWKSKQTKNLCHTFNIVGNIDLINKIQDILVYNCNISKNKLNHNVKNSYNIVTLSYSGSLQITKIKEWLYKNHANLFLQRKKEKFEQVKVRMIKNKEK